MLPDGRHTLGPDTGTLQVRTSREGAYAKAGHDLVMNVSTWHAVLDVLGDAVTLEITADPKSINVKWGLNGSDSLNDQNRADISKTIDAKVLKGAAISFRSTRATAYGEATILFGDLTIGQYTRPVQFELRPSSDGNRVDATARITQSDFGIKPYSAMLGTLKVRDVVEIVARATFPPAWARPVVERPTVVEPAPVEVQPEPAPTYTAQPEPAPTYAPQPEPAPTYAPQPEPAPTYAPQPEPAPTYTAQPEPAPTYVPQPEPAPTYVSQPEPVETYAAARNGSHDEPVVAIEPTAPAEEHAVSPMTVEEWLQAEEDAPESEVQAPRAEAPQAEQVEAPEEPAADTEPPAPPAPPITTQPPPDVHPAAQPVGNGLRPRWRIRL
jgi:polyisoprenoid-binding protein YceI